VIQQITLRNFRNFSNTTFSFENKNFIHGKNGVGKTNILEAISIFDTPIVDIDFSFLLKKWEENLYIELVLENGKTLALSYDQDTKKKKYLINKKSTTKKKVQEIIPSIVSFHPLGMNMMYLWPSKRRDFLDSTLTAAYPEYSSHLKKYKKIVTSRNRVLKNISEWKSNISEIDFWNTSFINAACVIYSYRSKLVEFIQSRIWEIEKYFSGKITDVDFTYITKVHLLSPKESIQEYLARNKQRDIFLRKTAIGPHVDDFDILVDTSPIADFASRWEVKSSIIGLKFLEAEFLRYVTDKPTIFLIDDLMSELDGEHKDMILENIWSSQTYITSIEKLWYEGKKINL